MDEEERTERSSYCSRTGENKASVTDVGLSTRNETCRRGGDKLVRLETRLDSTESPGLSGDVLEWSGVCYNGRDGASLQTGSRNTL